MSYFQQTTRLTHCKIKFQFFEPIKRYFNRYQTKTFQLDKTTINTRVVKQM